MFHYSKDSTTYEVARDAVPLFQDEDNNPLINELGIYILDKLWMFQNMQDYAVTADTDIRKLKKPRFSLTLDDVSATPAAAGPAALAIAVEGGEDGAIEARSGQNSPHS